MLPDPVFTPSSPLPARVRLTLIASAPLPANAHPPPSEYLPYISNREFEEATEGAAESLRTDSTALACCENVRKISRPEKVRSWICVRAPVYVYE